MTIQKQVALKNVNFSFVLGGQLFFENVSMDCKVGALNFVCGKNGMGKSTLLKIILGNAPAQQSTGTLQVDSIIYNLAHLQGSLPQVAMVAQNFNTMLVDSYSFYENMQFALLAQYPSFAALPTPKPLPLFVEKYGINPSIPIYLLSGGQRQILSMLMVLERSPKILLLDEPTAALDEENVEIVMNFLQDLCMQEHITIIAIVHNLDVVARYAGGSYFELYQEYGIRKMRTVLLA